MGHTNTSFLLNHRVGIVIVDRFVILCLNSIPNQSLPARRWPPQHCVPDPQQKPGCHRHLGDMLFIGRFRTLKVRNCTIFHQLDEVLYPNWFAGKFDGVGNDASLIVSPTLTDNFGTRTKRRHRYENGHRKLVRPGLHPRRKSPRNRASLFTRDRGRFGAKKGNRNSREPLSVEAFQQLDRNR